MGHIWCERAWTCVQPDLRATADIDGHKDIAFMIERYVHGNPGSRAEAIKSYEAWLGN